jgi:hypothetical protein
MFLKGHKLIDSHLSITVRIKQATPPPLLLVVVENVFYNTKAIITSLAQDRSGFLFVKTRL